MNEFDIADFWDRVKKLCKEKKITQKDLSAQIGYEQRTIEAQIFKKSVPDIEEVFKIATIFNVSIEFLVTGNETNPLKEEVMTLKEKIERVKQILA